jgi:uncharacterized protein YbbK (DUF523 family)/uncharacterized protein YbgA (DUF1722 family)
MSDTAPRAALCRPRLAVSQCLGFKAVRYNGAIIRDDFVQHLAHFADIVEVCPEVGIGLGVPRDPIRMQRNTTGGLTLYQPATQRDITTDMHAFTNTFISEIAHAVDGFILKSRSPSCGIAGVSVFDVDGTTVVDTNAGMFAQHVVQQFPALAIRDEMQLRDAAQRAHFLTRVWAHASLRATKSKHDLIEFHTAYKYLLMAYDARLAMSLGQVLGRMTSHTESVSEYRTLLAAAMSEPPRTGPWINAVMHMFGYLSERAGAEWRDDFIARTDALRAHDTSAARASVTQRLHAMARTLDEPYLQAQKFFEPFPSELA